MSHNEVSSIIQSEDLAESDPGGLLNQLIESSLASSRSFLNENSVAVLRRLEASICFWRHFCQQIGEIKNNKIRKDIQSHVKTIDITPLNQPGCFVLIGQIVRQRIQMLNQNHLCPKQWQTGQQLALVWLISKILDYQNVIDTGYIAPKLETMDWELIENILPFTSCSCEHKWDMLNSGHRSANFNRQKWHPLETVALRAIIEKIGAGNWNQIAYRLNKKDPAKRRPSTKSPEQCEVHWRDYTININKRGIKTYEPTQGQQKRNNNKKIKYLAGYQKQKSSKSCDKKNRTVMESDQGSHFSDSKLSKSQSEYAMFKGKDAKWVQSQLAKCLNSLNSLLEQAKMREQMMRNQIKQLQKNQGSVHNRHSKNNGMNIFNFKKQSIIEKEISELLQAQKQEEKPNNLPPLDCQRKTIYYIDSDFIIQQEPSSSEDEGQRAQQEQDSDFSGIFD